MTRFVRTVDESANISTGTAYFTLNVTDGGVNAVPAAPTALWTEGAVNLAENWTRNRLIEMGIGKDWVDVLFPPGQSPTAELVVLSSENRAEVSRKSSEFRKVVRGELIGELG